MCFELLQPLRAQHDDLKCLTVEFLIFRINSSATVFFYLFIIRSNKRQEKKKEKSKVQSNRECYNLNEFQ